MDAVPDTVHLGDETIDVAVTIGFGPRVIRLARPGQCNVFAELPEAGVEHPNGGVFRFRGGHRLWIAPEVPESTYIPDDDPVAVATGGGAIAAVAAGDTGGLRRTIRVTLAPGGTVVADHTIENRSRGAVEAAAWAITQFPPDGVAVVPLDAAPADGAGVQANRTVVLWPYTDLGAPGVAWTAATATISGSIDPKPFKIGIENRRGWLGYWRDGELFVKWAGTHRGGVEYADHGASAQVYRDNRFIELETLSPLVTLEPGESICHREVWRLYQVPLDDPAGLTTALSDLGVNNLPDEVEEP